MNVHEYQNVTSSLSIFKPRLHLGQKTQTRTKKMHFWPWYTNNYDFTLILLLLLFKNLLNGCDRNCFHYL
jgi:hypothetical protein